MQRGPPGPPGAPGPYTRATPPPMPQQQPQHHHQQQQQGPYGGPANAPPPGPYGPPPGASRSVPPAQSPQGPPRGPPAAAPNPPPSRIQRGPPAPKYRQSENCVVLAKLCIDLHAAPGDRSHIPDSSLPAYTIISEQLNRLRQTIPVSILCSLQ
jgi:protein transport protein SEC31